mgnify:CR=1 FL=1
MAKFNTYGYKATDDQGFDIAKGNVIAMSTQSASPAPVTGNHDDSDYRALLSRLQARVTTALESDARLFTTDAQDLWTVYLTSFDVPVRQYHNCSACRRFIEIYGGLVTIDASGLTHSAVWHPDDAPAAYMSAVTLLRDVAETRPVSGVFISARPVLGLTAGVPLKRLP